jgi:hypothetical protein
MQKLDCKHLFLRIFYCLGFIALHEKEQHRAEKYFIQVTRLAQEYQSKDKLILFLTGFDALHVVCQNVLGLTDQAIYKQGRETGRAMTLEEATLVHWNHRLTSSSLPNKSVSSRLVTNIPLIMIIMV